jgi:hypothetical protein
LETPSLKTEIFISSDFGIPEENSLFVPVLGIDDGYSHFSLLDSRVIEITLCFERNLLFLSEITFFGILASS